MSLAAPAVAPAPRGVDETAAAAVRCAREQAAAWARTSLDERCRIVRRLRHRIADDPVALAKTVTAPWRDDASTTLTSEIQPLLDACRFLERRAAKILAPRRLGRRGRPVWLTGTACEVRREPFGVVLVIGPANYPILLPGVQLLQALIAGNTVVVKPGRTGEAAMRHLADALRQAGLPDGVLHVLGEEVAAATAAIDAGVDKVVLTGSMETGVAVLHRLADPIIPAVMELSGFDALIVREDADLDLAARAAAFATTLNGGFTCIAPRRLLVHRSVAEPFAAWLRSALRSRSSTATMPEVTPIDDDDEAVRLVREHRYRLGAAVFGSRRAATALARRLDVGVVVVNDAIVPTADPRLPFGGRGAAGFGSTRGAEGLLEMTTPKTLAVRHGRLRAHYDPTGPKQVPFFAAFIRMVHGGSLGGRLRALGDLVREARR